MQERTPALRLREQGYTVVIPAGSQALVDLVAWDGAGVRFIRIATDRAAALATEVEMGESGWPPGSRAEVWWRAARTWNHRVVCTPPVSCGDRVP